MVIDAKNVWKIFVISGASALSAILICEKLKCFFVKVKFQTPTLNHTRVIFFLCFCVFWIWAHFSLSSPHCWKLELKLWNLKSFYHLRIRRKGRLAWIKTHLNDLLLPWFRLCWVNGLVFDAFFRSKLVRGVKLAKIQYIVVKVCWHKFLWFIKIITGR